MSICSGCGGVLGRDCYNESECVWIGQNQESYYQAQSQIDEMIREGDLIPMSKVKVLIDALKSIYDPDYDGMNDPCSDLKDAQDIVGKALKTFEDMK